MASGAAAGSRRDRVRAATVREIIQTARRLLVAEGSAAISLRAIGREMGMTAPAIYRYFDSHEVLIHHVVADIFTELSDYVEAEARTAEAAAGTGVGTGVGTGAAVGAGRAGASSGAGAGRRGSARAVPSGDPAADAAAAGLITACHAFRGWAIGHPAEFGMIFGSPLPGVDLFRDHPRPDDPAAECGMRFGAIFLRLFTDLWLARPFGVPADADIDESLRGQLARYRDMTSTDLPLGVLLTFLRCWVQLYGTVSLEVFGHLRFALDDPSGMFELMLSDLAGLLALDYPAPVRP